MIPEFVLKHYAYKNECSLQRSKELHAKLENYFNRVATEGIVAPTTDVDEVWHNFILHTKLYRDYCLDNFGMFIHHNPKLPKNVDELILCNGKPSDKIPSSFAKCDNQCNGGTKCDNQCNGGNKCDNQCNGGSWCESTITIGTQIIAQQDNIVLRNNGASITLAQ